MRARLIAISAIFCILTAGNVASAVERVALVIGNSDYARVIRLKNAANDARVLARKLRAMGFSKVDLQLNLGGNALRDVLGRFSQEAAGADIAMVYFAGHGMEVNGKNYLIPTDARLDHVDDVEFQAVELSKLMYALNRAKKLKLVVLDACRNNPFQNTMAGQGANRSVGRGLARVNPAGSDTYVAYAAKEGTVAADGTGEHSPYAAALIKHIDTPGLDVRFLFAKVRDDVREATGFKQEPYTYGSLPGESIFLANPAETVQAPAAGPATPAVDREALFWSSVKDSKSVAVISTYLEQFPSGQFAGLARAKIAELTPVKQPARIAKLQPLRHIRPAKIAPPAKSPSAADASYAFGLSQKETGNHKGAEDLLLGAAMKGHRAAMLALADLYDKGGPGFRRSPLRARNWRNRAAESGKTKRKKAAAKQPVRPVLTAKQKKNALRQVWANTYGYNERNVLKIADAQIRGHGQTSVNFRSAASKYLDLYRYRKSERARRILESGAPGYPAGFKRQIQIELKRDGFYRGRVDGRIGASTIRALKAYRASYR